MVDKRNVVVVVVVSVVIVIAADARAIADN